MNVRFLVNEFFRSHLYAPKELLKFRSLPLEEQNPRTVSHFMQSTQGQSVNGSVLPVVDSQMLSRIPLGLKQPGGKMTKWA